MAVIHHLRGLGKQRTYPFPGCAALREHGNGFPCGDHGPYQRHDIGVKGHKLAQCNVALNDKVAAIEQRQAAGNTNETVQQRQNNGPKLYHMEIGLLVFPGDLLKCLHVPCFLNKCLDDADT